MATKRPRESNGTEKDGAVAKIPVRFTDAEMAETATKKYHFEEDTLAKLGKELLSTIRDFETIDENKMEERVGTLKAQLNKYESKHLGNATQLVCSSLVEDWNLIKEKEERDAAEEEKKKAFAATITISSSSSSSASPDSSDDAEGEKKEGDKDEKKDAPAKDTHTPTQEELQLDLLKSALKQGIKRKVEAVEEEEYTKFVKQKKARHALTSEIEKVEKETEEIKRFTEAHQDHEQHTKKILETMKRMLEEARNGVKKYEMTSDIPVAEKGAAKSKSK